MRQIFKFSLTFCIAMFGLSYSSAAVAESSQTISCRSSDYRLSYCHASADIKKAYVQQRLSSANCKFNKSWGYSGNRLWVNNGCSADFIVFTKTPQSYSSSDGIFSNDIFSNNGYTRPTQRPLIQRHSIVCYSRGFRRSFCDAGGQIENLSIRQQLGSGDCYHGVSWGYSGREIWVDKGCGAEFLADTRTRSSNYTYDRDRNYRPQPNHRGTDYRHRPTYKGKSRSMLCFSNNYQRKYCDAGGIVETLSITQKLSSQECYHGKSWGYSGSKIWVDKGCSAKFLVHTK